VQFPQDVIKGWDVYDAIRERGWGLNEIVEYAKANLIADPQKLTLGSGVVEKEETPKEEPTEDITSIFNRGPFQLLGHNRGFYYYHPRETKQVLEVPYERHSSKALSVLAPVKWWEGYFPSKHGIDWTEAVSSLFREQHRLGIYDVSRVRGCGSWIDENRVVIHCGDHLDVDGERKQVYDIESKFIYEASIKKRINDDPPITTEESAKLLDICESLCWEKDVNGKLLAGWVVLAPICGALNWRPHIQITGGAGSGKTWTIETIIQPILGDIVLQVTSNTTEAGIRQKLKSNAFPILFDEAEGESVRSRIRVQDTLDLMRQASSESGASIAKGNTKGTGIEFKIRSCFCIASIGVPMTQHADVSRVTVLTLQVNTAINRMQQFEELKRKVRETINPLWSSGLRGRSIRMIKTILKNIEVFSKATAEILGTQRMGDQVGSLLAAAYSLKSDAVCAYDKALEWVGSQNWDEYKTESLDTDEYRCISRILQKSVMVKNDSRNCEVSVSEMVEQLVEEMPKRETISMGEWGDKRWSISFEEAELSLKRMGIKVTKDADWLIVSDNNAVLQKYMSESPWGVNWGKILRRIPNSEKRTSERFSMGVRQRATAIPMGWLKVGGYTEEEAPQDDWGER